MFSRRDFSPSRHADAPPGASGIHRRATRTRRPASPRTTEVLRLRSRQKQSRRPSCLQGAEAKRFGQDDRPILSRASAPESETWRFRFVSPRPRDDGAGRSSDAVGRGKGPRSGRADESRSIKVKSGLLGNLEEQPSEIPCRVSSDLHEWCNELTAVSCKSSAKL